MDTHIPSRRTVVKGAAALALSGALAPFAVTARAQGAGPAALRAAMGHLPELAGSGPVALFNDALPGPPLRVAQGTALAVKVDNALPEPLTLVWQGVRTAAGAAPPGGPVASGSGATFTFTPRDAGTYWYHAASPGLTQRALAGALVVEEPGAPRYESDQLALIQVFPPESGTPVFTVNGARSPTLQGPAAGRTRLRLVNATPLFLRLHITAPAVYVIAVDGRPAEPFAPKDNRVQMAPGGRIDLAVTLDDADPAVIAIETAQFPIQLAILAPVGPGGTAPDGAPSPLPAADLPKALPFKDAARFEIDLSDPASVSAPTSIGAVKKGKVVMLTLANPLDAPVAVRIDGHPVRLLDAVYDGWSPWWHDTVPVPARSKVRVAFQAATVGNWSIVAQRGGDGRITAARSYTVTA